MNKPSVTLSDENGNIFNLAAITRRALINHHGHVKGKELSNKMLNEIMKSDSYESALLIIAGYVDIY